MKISETSLKGVLILEPRIFRDPRGYFFESYNRQAMEKSGLHIDFVQDNQSLSQKGTLRGLHFQAPPHAQAKLVRVIKGSVLDVVVDIRNDSPGYGRHFSCVLSEANSRQLLIPKGFAHGFLALENDTIFAYKCSHYYHKESEGGLLWNDPELGIDWGLADPLVSEKDRELPSFASFRSPFR